MLNAVVETQPTTDAEEWPSQWPALSVTTRATGKINKVHYKKGPGRLGQNKEGAGRAYSPRIIDELNTSIAYAPSPIHDIFTFILATGTRSEDGNAVLFDCLKEDPRDSGFMLLSFWQN